MENKVIAKRNIKSTYGELLFQRGNAYKYEELSNGHYLVEGRFWRSATMDEHDFKKFFKKPAAAYLVKSTCTCIKAGGVHEVGETLVFYVGKDDFVHSEPYWDCGWATKRSAEAYIGRTGVTEDREYWHEENEVVAVAPPEHII